jgi:hypothetical protein
MDPMALHEIARFHEEQLLSDGMDSEERGLMVISTYQLSADNSLKPVRFEGVAGLVTTS